MTTLYEYLEDGAIVELWEGREPDWSHRGPPLSLAFVCTQCGDLFMRRRVPFRAFLVYHGTCLKHEYGGQPGGPPGSIWAVLLPSDKACLPPEVVHREFELHLDYYEKENQ